MAAYNSPCHSERNEESQRSFAFVQDDDGACGLGVYLTLR